MVQRRLQFALTQNSMMSLCDSKEGRNVRILNMFFFVTIYLKHFQKLYA